MTRSYAIVYALTLSNFNLLLSLLSKYFLYALLHTDLEKQMNKIINSNKNVIQEKGFTLVELMIVVAIIGILAAIAIPNFRNYQMKAKSAEAKTNIGSIRTSLEAYEAEYDTFLGNLSYPGVAMGTKTTWTTTDANAANFSVMGFNPSGQVYFGYTINGTTTNFEIVGTADIDSDGAVVAEGTTYANALTVNNNNSIYHLDESGNFVDRRPGIY